MTTQLHHFCDRIVAINLPYKPERRAALTRNLGETGLARPDDITWSKAISGDWCPPPSWWGAGNGAWGCLMSHVRAVRNSTWHGLAARGPRNVVSGKNPGRKGSVSRRGKAFRKPNVKAHGLQARATFLDQRRGHNDLNLIGSLATAQETAWDEEHNPLTSDKVEHDANGNMLLLPHGSDGDWGKAMKLTWDAWNRLVKVAKASDDTEIARYQYDGLWRRTVKVITGEFRHYYYNDQWRSIEEHLEKADTTKVVEQQHFWGPHHRWEYIRRDRNTTPLTTSVLNETLYALSDAMSITAIVDTTGAIKERYQYSAFGQRLCVSATGAALTESAFVWMLGFHVEFSDASGGGLVDSGLTNYGYRYYDTLCGRWLGRDPANERLSNSLYSFVLPINQIDIIGLWDSETHKQILKDYFDSGSKLPHPVSDDCSCCPGLKLSDELWKASNIADGVDPETGDLSSAQILKLIAETANGAQEGPQGSKFAYKHAMRDAENGQTIAEAESKYDDFLDSSKTEVRQLGAQMVMKGMTGQARCDQIKKMANALGQAIHALADSFSPAHKGFKPWGADRSSLKPGWNFQGKQVMDRLSIGSQHGTGPYSIERIANYRSLNYSNNPMIKALHKDSNFTNPIPEAIHREFGEQIRLLNQFCANEKIS